MGALVVQLTLSMNGRNLPMPAALEEETKVGFDALEQPEPTAIAATAIVAQMTDICRDIWSLRIKLISRMSRDEAVCDGGLP
jgi:hypothetical protein